MQIQRINLGSRLIGLWLILGGTYIASVPVLAQDLGLNESTVSANHSIATNFLETMSWPDTAARIDGFNANNAPHWNLEKVMSHLGSIVEFLDVNDNSDVHLTKTEIKEQLAARRGKAFDAFAHLSYIYSQRSKDSELTFKDSPNNFTVYMGGWYIFTFICKDNKPYLTSVHYTELEGD